MAVFSKLILPLALALSTVTQAGNQVIFRNYCSYPLHFWIVRPSLHTPDTQRITVPSNTSHYHAMEPTTDGGIALKIRDVPFYEVAPAGILQVEYKVDAKEFWYDLSRINCDINLGADDPSYCPFIAGGVELVATEPWPDRCPTAWCAGTHCVHTYESPGYWKGEPTFNCPVGNDIVFSVCTQGDAPVTFGWDKKEEEEEEDEVDWKPAPVVQQVEPTPSPVAKMYTYEQCFAVVNGTGFH